MQNREMKSTEILIPLDDLFNFDEAPYTDEHPASLLKKAPDLQSALTLSIVLLPSLLNFPSVEGLICQIFNLQRST